MKVTKFEFINKSDDQGLGGKALEVFFTDDQGLNGSAVMELLGDNYKDLGVWRFNVNKDLFDEISLNQLSEHLEINIDDFSDMIPDMLMFVRGEDFPRGEFLVENAPDRRSLLFNAVRTAADILHDEIADAVKGVGVDAVEGVVKTFIEKNNMKLLKLTSCGWSNDGMLEAALTSILWREALMPYFNNNIYLSLAKSLFLPDGFVFASTSYKRIDEGKLQGVMGGLQLNESVMQDIALANGYVIEEVRLILTVFVAIYRKLRDQVEIDPMLEILDRAFSNEESNAEFAVMTEVAS